MNEPYQILTILTRIPTLAHMYTSSLHTQSRLNKNKTFIRFHYFRHFSRINCEKIFMMINVPWHNHVNLLLLIWLRMKSFFYIFTRACQVAAVLSLFKPRPHTNWFSWCWRIEYDRNIVLKLILQNFRRPNSILILYANYWL